MCKFAKLLDLRIKKLKYCLFSSIYAIAGGAFLYIKIRRVITVGIWYDFNLHVRGRREQCEPLYQELDLALNGGSDEDDNEVEPEKAFNSFREGAENQGEYVFALLGDLIHFQTGDDGIREEPYGLFLSYIERHPDVSLLFEGVSDTDDSRACFYYLFENGKKTQEYYNSFDFSDYDDQEECIEERDNDFKKNVSPFVKNWLAEAEKDNTLYGKDAAFYIEEVSWKKMFDHYDEALACINKALELAPNGTEEYSLPDLYNIRAYCYKALGQLEDAIADAGRGLEVSPDGMTSKGCNLWDTRAEMYEAAGEYEKAIADSKKALELTPNLEESKERLARLEGKD
jgi:tetratricopeptide (TPR) repeat protein